MIRTGNFRYVIHRLVDKFHGEGWMVVDDLGLVHGYHAVLMWRCDCFGD